MSLPEHGDKRLRAALGYADRSWPVFPLHSPVLDSNGGTYCSCSKCPKDSKNIGKHPRTQYGFKDATINTDVVRQWWTKWPEANVGIATGAISDIVVIDVDPRNGGGHSLEVLEDEHGKLPGTIEAHTGGGGHHFLFKHPRTGYVVKNSNDGKKLGPGIDIKGDGGYIVAPPSLHASGAEYAWESSHEPGQIELAEMPSWLAEQVTERTEQTEDNRSNLSFFSVVSAPSVLSAISVTEAVAEQIVKCINETIPSYQGHRNSKIFDFCRCLKAIPCLFDASAKDLRELVRLWHQAALPYIGTKAFDDTYADFVYGWQRVKFPAGQEPMATIIKRANEALLPNWATAYDRPETQLLVKLCRELQLNSGDNPFYLSCRTAGRVLKIDHVTAWRLLGILLADEVIRLVKAGTKTKAARYHCVERT